MQHVRHKRCYQKLRPENLGASSVMVKSLDLTKTGCQIRIAKKPFRSSKRSLTLQNALALVVKLALLLAMRDRQAMPKDYSCRQIQQAQRGLFLRFLISLVKDPDSLRSHASNNARIPWFHKRIKFKPQECSIISTTWMFSQYCDWKHDLGQFADGSVEEACARQYANPSGEQKSFTLFLRQNVLKRVGDSQRLKGQDTAEGMSEYFIVIPGGIETLDEALKEVPMSGEPCASCTYMS